MDINSLYNISGNIITDPYVGGLNQTEKTESKDVFASFFQSAVDTINATNGYLSDAENEKIRFALGEAENTHDLTNALSKASSAVSYTVAIRDKFLEAYNTIMQMQI